jgi:xanthine dehydrogenase accessory factor
MKEIKKILEKYAQTDFNTRKAAIATVVKVEGSSYRRSGARMLMTDDGRWEGAISGGCLEGDVLRKARQVILEKKPMLVLYDTNEDGSGNMSINLGCNGLIEVLIEPVEDSYPSNPVTLLNYLLDQKEPSVVATIFQVDGQIDAKVGERIIYQREKIVESVKSNEIREWLKEESQSVLDGNKSITKTYTSSEGFLRVFFEVVQPDIHLIIFGGGYDAVPLTKQAKEMGWKVTVTDECVAHLLPSRFPQADLVTPSERTSFLSVLDITKRTAIALLTHSYKYDKTVIEQLASTDVGYVGVLGPKKRFLKMETEWQLEGKVIDSENIFSPAGLDLGAETPEEIALAIVSEIQAHFAGKRGGFLKEKQGAIHERQLEVIASLPFENQTVKV